MLQKTVNSIYIFLLIFCPLALGTTNQWSLAIMESLCFLALFLFIIYQKLHNRPFYKTPGLIPAILFLIYILIQIIPLPSQVLKIITPNTYDLYSSTIGLIDPNAWLSISVNKRSTLLEFFRYAAYISFYVLTVQILTDKEKLQNRVVLVISFMTGLAVFAIVQYFTSKDTVFWFIEVPRNSIIFGPYINHNHYAGLMELVLPIAIALFIYLKPKVTYKQTLREKIVEIFDFHGTNFHVLLGFAALLIAVSIFLSLSRGGMISASLSVFILVATITYRFKQKQKALFIFLLLGLVVLVVGWFGWDAIFERFGRLQNAQGEIYEARLDFWKDSINIIKAFAVTGTGFGTFPDIYPVFRTFIHERSVLHAHNDYLELLIEGGGIAFILVIIFLYRVFSKSFRYFWRRHDRYSIYLFLGSFCGLVSIFIHSVTDFNLHIGANGLYFFFIAGLMVSAAGTKLRMKSGNTLLYTTRENKNPIIAVALLFSLFVACTTINVGILIAQNYYRVIDSINLNARMPQLKLERIHHFASLSSQADPLDGKYHFAKANIESLLLEQDKALASYQQSIQANPLKGEFLQRLGLIYSWLENNEKAEAFLLAAIKTDQSNPVRYKAYAEWLFDSNRKLEAMPQIRTALSYEPNLSSRKARAYALTMFVNGIKDDDVLNAIPQETRPLLGIADYYLSVNNFSKAEELYLKALDSIEKDPKKTVWHYHRIYRFYLKRKELQKALDIALKTAEDLPDDSRPRIWAGRLYKKMGITYRASEEYKIALALDPNNKQAKRELDQLMQ